MSEDSAKRNVIPALMAFNIIDQDLKPTDRAKLWRDDEQYAKVCEQIRKEIYPQDLLDSYPPPNPDRDGVNRWIKLRTGVGDNAAIKYTQTYLMLCTADPKVGQEVIVDASKPLKRPLKQIVIRSQKKSEPSHPNMVKSEETAKAAKADQTYQTPPAKPIIDQPIPAIHINIQIHITADTSNDQIDKIFESMARNFGKLTNKTYE
jgi:hypothetical protein